MTQPRPSLARSVGSLPRSDMSGVGEKPTSQDSSTDAFDPIRKLADCGASRFEDDILATWYRYQSAKQPFLPELPGQKRSPPEVRNSLWTRG